MENPGCSTMEGELQETQKFIPAGDANATPLKNYVSTKSPASPSKVLIITPEQIAKLGLTQQIKSVVESQVASKALHKNRPRVSRISIIDDTPSNSSNKDAALEINQSKKQKDESNEKEAASGSSTASRVNELENITQNPEEKQDTNTEKRENVKQPKTNETNITEDDVVRNKNILEDDIIIEQEKKVTLTTENDESMNLNTTNIVVTPKKGKLVVLDTTKGSDIAKETGDKVSYNSLNSSLTNQMTSSIRSKLSSMLETDTSSAHKSSTSVKDTKPELVTNSENKSRKRYKNLLEDGIITEQEKKVTLTTENDESMKFNTTNIVVTPKKGKLVVQDTTEGSNIAKETGAKVPYNSLNSSLTNQMISSIKSKLSSMLKADISSAHTSSTSIKDTKPELVTNSENKSKKRKQANCKSSLPLKTSKTISPTEVPNKPENIPSKTNVCSTNETKCDHLNEKNNINDLTDTIVSSVDLDVSEVTEIATNKSFVKRRIGKVQPRIRKSGKITKKNIEQASVLQIPERENTNCATSSIAVESSNATTNTSLTKETTDSIGETRPHKIHVLSNEQISLPQTYIKQMLKENFNQNQKINICNPALKKSIPNDSRPTKLISGLDVEQNKITDIAGEPHLINSLSKLIPSASYGNENNFSLPPAVDSVLSTSKTEIFKLKDTVSGTDISTSELSGNSNQQNISSSNIGGLVNAKSDSIMTKEEIIVSSANVDQSPKKEDLVDTVSNEQSANAVANINMVASKLKEIQTILPDKLSNQKRAAKFLTGLKNSTHVDQGITSNAPVSMDINHSQKLKNVTDIPNISESKDLEAKDKLHPLEQKTIAETVIIHPQKLKNVAETSTTIESNKNLEIQNELYPLDGKTVEENASVVTVTGVTQNITQPQKMKIKEKSHSSDVTVIQAIRKPEKKKSVKTRKTSESNKNLETKEKLKTSDSETTAIQSTHPPQNVKNLGTLKISNSDINLEIEGKRLPINVLGKAESSESTKLAAESSIGDFSKEKLPMKIENVSQKPKIGKLEFVKSEIIKDDIHFPVPFKLTKVDPVSVRHSEESVNHTEKNESEGNKVLGMPTQQVTLTPKKRGRKKKSEMVAKEEPEFRPNVPIIEVGTSKRSGRKRQVVDYSALAEGVEFDEVKPKKPKIEKIKNEHSIVEVATPSIDDSSTDRSLLLVKTIQEVASMDNEVNSFLPLDSEADKEATTEKQREHEITLIRIEGEYTSEEEVGVLKRKMTQKLTKEPIRTSVSQGFKRKRGRPRGGKKAENNLANKVMNTIFHHINTPTNSNENTEAEEQAIPHNEGMLDNVRQDRGDTPSSVTCAVCYAEMKKSGWQYHKMRKHNNLTWRIGETPLDLSDQKLVVNILTDLYKRRKPLYCEFCEQPKKSVMGFLSHKSICQKTSEEIQSMRIKCEFCEKSVMPISMSAHLKFCKALNPENKVQEDPEQAVIPEMPSTGKRKAATKAEKLIQVFKEDGTFTLINEKPKNTQKWYVNFDFHPTFFATRWIQHQITDHGKMKCIFAECQFESSYAVEMANHIWTCSRKPTEGFTCRFCMTTRQTEDDIVEHMQQNHDRTHSDTSPLDEESEDNVIEKEEELIDDNIVDYKECKAKPPNKTNLMHGIKFLLLNRFCAPTMGVTYPPAFDWTLKFCHENLSTRNLYSNWRLNWMCYEKLSPDLVIKYLPRVRYSACTARMETKKFVDPLKLDYDWKRYKLFESEMLHNGTSIMFCGGSIFSMAWLPTPFDEPNCEQILAVSTDSSMDKEYRLNDVYREPGLIQFWNCGLLTNEEDSDDKPKLQFCIAHDYGPAWCLEWCPSGCYDVERIEKSDYLQRLGVLAVGCADAHIYIYSINLPDQTGSKIFKTKPVLKLVLDTVAEETVSGIEAHVTKISWSKVSGHQVLVAGYANGMVAIYDLNSTSVLLKAGHDQNDVEMLMPYRIFMAHYHAITALSVYHLNDGRRWLMTGSVDRSIKYWDLENPTVPITNFTKLIVTDGVWLNHWLSTVQTFDDSCGGGLTYTAAHQLRNFESETSTVMLSNSRVSSITGNEWVNGFVQGNTVGEVKGFFPHQMFYSMDGDKSSRSKKVILGYARLVEKNVSVQERIKEEQQKLKHVNSKPAQPVDGDRMIKTKNFNINVDYAKPEPGTYKETEEKYGLVFCDMRVNCIKEFPANIDSYFKSNKVNKLYASRPNIYPMEAINKVAFNPNRGSFLYLASGYKVGFVRISCLRFLNRI